MNLICKMDFLAILIIGLSWVHLWQPTPVFCLENSMDREDWQATAHGSQRAGYNCVTENIYIFTHTHIYTYIYIFGVSLVAQRLKHLPAMQETWVQSLGQEDPLEKEMATHSSILFLENPTDCSLSGSSIHRIFQARIEWVAISLSKRSSPPRDQTQVSCIVDRRFTI